MGGFRSNVVGVAEVDASCCSCVMTRGAAVNGDNMLFSSDLWWDEAISGICERLRYVNDYRSI
jgi:hypothetical protein